MRAWRASVAVILVLAMAAGAGSAAKRAPRSSVREAAVGVLRWARVAHRAAWPLASAGAIFFGWRLARGRRLGRPRPGSARSLLACGSTLVGLAIIEGTAFAYLAWSHRLSIGPAMNRDAARASRDPRNIDLVVLGESSARGMPYDRWLSVGHIVEWQLRQALPGRDVRLEILAEDGATLEKALRRLDARPRPPDAVILYSGHNEVSGRFPLSRTVPHYEDEITRADRLSGWIRQASPLDRLLQEGLDAQLLDAGSGREERRLVDMPACTPKELGRLRDDFRARLDGLIAYCERSGSLPILIIPPGNDAGFEPNRSTLAASTPRARRDELAREFAATRAAEAADPARCMASYRSILERHPGFAEAHFRLARLLQGAGQTAEANRHYILARDLDGLPMRCTTPFEQAYRDAAAGRDCILVDGPAVLRRSATRGIIEGRLVLDAQHPSLIGYVALANDLLARLRRREAFGLSSATPAPPVDPARCATHFGMGLRQWAFTCYVAQVMWNGSQSYRYESAERSAAERRFERASESLMSGIPPEVFGLLDPPSSPAGSTPAGR